MLEPRKKKRRLSLMITILDFVIIFIVIFFINYYLFKAKTVQFEDLKIKYKYDKLRENMGYVFSLKIENAGKTNRVMKKNNKVIFFIEEKDSKKMIWEKHIPRPSFPMNVSKTDLIILKPEELISYTYIYDLQNEVFLPEGEWRFGSRVTIGTNELTISISRSTKPAKGIYNFFR